MAKQEETINMEDVSFILNQKYKFYNLFSFEENTNTGIAIFHIIRMTQIRVE